MSEFHDKISTNFISHFASDSIDELFASIESQNPEYVIIIRIDKTDTNQILNTYHYCYPAKLLTIIKKRFPERLSLKNIFDFLDLHENKSTTMKKITKNLIDLDDNEIQGITRENHKEIVLTNEAEILGVVDQNRNNRRASYDFLGEVIFPYRDSEEPDPLNAGKFRGFFSKGLRSKGLTKNFTRKDTKPKIKKFITAKFRDSLQVGKETLLQIKINDAKSTDLTTYSKPVEIDPDQVEEDTTHVNINVKVYSDDPDIADVVGKTDKIIRVPLDKSNSNNISFKIMPKKEGKCTIVAEMLYLKTNLKVGSIKFRPKIGPSESEVVDYATDANMERERKAPDMIMRILKMPTTNKNKQFEYVMLVDAYQKTGKLTAPYTLLPQNKPEEWFKNLYKRIESINPEEWSTKRAKVEIESIGTDLWEKLIPDNFKEDYWKIYKDKIESIHIDSSEPWIPWELVRPTRSVDEGGPDKFFCEKFAMTRWIQSADTFQKPLINNIKFVRPSDTQLPEVDNETKQLTEKFGEKKCSTIKSLDELLQCLRNDDFDILHFSTHGKFPDDLDPNESYLEMQNKEPFKALYLTDDRCPSIKRNNPLVILNACETGRAGVSLTGLGGWAERFVKTKAFAVLGNLWKVNNHMACLFSLKLYENLKSGMSLDVAVQQARIQARDASEIPGDPSWLSFSLYAPPCEVIQIAK